MNRYLITFDKSQEDIPVLMVAREDGYFYGLGGSPSISIVNTITGDKAVQMWAELTKSKENEK